MSKKSKKGYSRSLIGKTYVFRYPGREAWWHTEWELTEVAERHTTSPGHPFNGYLVVLYNEPLDDYMYINEGTFLKEVRLGYLIPKDPPHAITL